MDLKSMRVTPEKAMPASPEIASPEYPYGLCLRLGEDQISKLGIKELPALGKTVKVYAMAEVVAVAEADTGRGVTRNLELQITDLGLQLNKKNPEDVLYGSK